MANKPISVTIKGDYSDKDIKRAIRDLQSLQTQGPRTHKALSNVGKGLAIAGAAAAAFAVKLGVDAVQAAIEEEQSVARLSKTLENLGLATQSAGVERFIDDMQFATGIADNDLRPAMDRLVRSTGDVGEAQRALAIASDIAVAKGRSVTEVANILGKAYDGNTMSLGRLGVGLDKDILKSGDMALITAELAKLFSGQAADAADTLGGRLAILRIGVDELQESFGQGLIQGFMDGLTGGSESINDISDSMRDNQATVEVWGEAIGGIFASALQSLDAFGMGTMKLADTWSDALALMERGYINLADTLGWMSDAEAEAARKSLDAADAQREAAMRAYALGGANDDVAASADAAAGSTNRLTSATNSSTTSMDRQRSAAKRLKSELDKLNDNRSIMRQRIQLRRMLEEGPQGTGKDGKVTARDRRLFALDVADARAQLGEDIYERGGKGSRAKARRQFALGRENIRDLGFGNDFAVRVLGTPDELRRNSTTQQRVVGAQTGASPTTVNYNFAGDIVVQRTEQAIQEAKRLARLSKLGRGPVAPVESVG